MTAEACFKEKIYTEYYEKVAHYVRSHVGDPNDREDVTQTVFLKVYGKLDSFDERKASISTWIYTIAKNTVIDYYRARKEQAPLPEALAEEIPEEDSLDDLSDALAELGERERDIVILHYYSGYTLKSVAEMMHISYVYAKVLHKTALGKLRGLLTENP